MKLNLIGPFVVNAPFGTEIAFAKGLREIGVEVVEVDPNVDKMMVGLDQQADCTMIFKSCCGAEWKLNELRHPKIVYQPDDARFPHIREMMLMMRQKGPDLFLSFDDHSTAVARTMGYRAAETLLLTADPELYSPSPVPIERDIDVSFIGSLGDPVAHASRRRMLEWVSNEASHRGWKCAFYNTQDIPFIVDVYRRSKVVLNHATDVGQEFGFGFGLQCRHFEVGMTRTCLLSNNVPMPGSSLLYRTYNDVSSLIGELEKLIYGNYELQGKILHDSIMKEHLPIHRAKQLVDFIERNT